MLHITKNGERFTDINTSTLMKRIIIVFGLIVMLLQLTTAINETNITPETSTHSTEPDSLVVLMVVLAVLLIALAFWLIVRAIQNPV